MAYDSEKEEPTIFPSDFASPEQKASYEWGKQFLRAVYARNVAGSHLYQYYDDRKERFLVSRKYAEGLQSVDKYKELLDQEGDTSYLNLDFSVVSVIPKYVDQLVGEIINQDYKPTLTAVDPISKSEKNEKRNKYLANMKLKDFAERMENITGVKVIPEGEFVPESQEELDMHMQLNEKEDIEIAMEIAMTYVNDSNNWDEIEKLMIRDLIITKWGGIRLRFDDNGDIKIRRVKPENYITSYTDEPDFSKAKYEGELLYLPLYEIRRLAGNDLTEQQYFEIAKKHSGQYGNPDWAYGEHYTAYYNTYSYDYRYDNFLVPVLDAEVHTINTKTFEKKKNKYGGFYFNEKEYGYKAPEGDEREIIEKEIDVVYKGYFIPANDLVFKWGLATDMPRTKEGMMYSSETYTSFIMYSIDMVDMENKSMVERMIPFADQIQLAHLKTQQLLAKIAPPGMSVDISALSDVMIGKGQEDASPLELLELYFQTGVFFVNGETEDGMPMNRQPIAPIPNSILNALEECVRIYNYNLELIQRTAGFSDANDAVKLDKDALPGAQKHLLMAHNDAIRPLIEGYLNIYERMEKRKAIMIQDAIEKKSEYEGFANAIGEQNIKMIDILDQIPLRSFGIHIETLPDNEELMLLEQNIQQSLASKDGMEGIRLEDAIMVRKIARTNVKSANQYLILRRRKYRAEKMAEVQANSEANAMQQQASIQAKAQADIQAAQMKGEVEMNKLRLEKELEDQNNESQHKRKLEEIKLANEYKSRHIEEASEEEFKNTALSKQVPQERVFTGTGTRK